MLCYAIFDLYQTRFSLLIERFRGGGAWRGGRRVAERFCDVADYNCIVDHPPASLLARRPAFCNSASGNSEDCAALAKGSLEGEQGPGASRRALSRPRFGATFLRHLVNSPLEMQGREV